jgi:hypothetical protein
MVALWLLMLILQVGIGAVLDKIMELPVPPTIAGHTEELWLYPKRTITEPYHIFYESSRSELQLSQSSVQFSVTAIGVSGLVATFTGPYPKVNRWLHVATAMTFNDTGMSCAMFVNAFKVVCSATLGKDRVQVFPSSSRPRSACPLDICWALRRRVSPGGSTCTTATTDSGQRCSRTASSFPS